MTFLEHAFIAHYAVPGRTAVEAAHEAQLTADEFCKAFKHDWRGKPSDGTICTRCLRDVTTLKEEAIPCEVSSS
jgi:hypothetical protein